MDTLEHGSTGVARLGSPVHWHFRSLPREVQRGTIRRLALSGLNEEQIAASTGLSVESVRGVVSEDDCLRHFSVLSLDQSRWSSSAPRGAPAN
jgi:hypothetical protein